MTLSTVSSVHPARKGGAKRAFTALILVGLLGAMGCSKEAAEPASSTSTSAADDASGQTFTQADTGKEALLAVGEEVVVSLETCGGCGYEWRVTEPADAAVVESSESTNQPRPTSSTQPGDPPLVGVPTDENFRFRGVAAGRTEVTIGYFPPAGAAPEESFTLVFVVA
ncbi:MAG TPA: protease inhibitor I42 family protein [Acidimicrobiales bacterium]|nr:protease inhibitor I42 family protein [Acidimicrobiales bacterium]